MVCCGFYAATKRDSAVFFIHEATLVDEAALRFGYNLNARQVELAVSAIVNTSADLLDLQGKPALRQGLIGGINQGFVQGL